MTFADHIENMDRLVNVHLSSGESVSYVAGDLSEIDVSGIFSASYEFVGAGYPGASSVAPAFFCRVDDLTSDPSVDDAARLTVNGAEYLIREAQPDGEGGTLLRLHKVVS